MGEKGSTTQEPRKEREEMKRREERNKETMGEKSSTPQGPGRKEGR